VVVYLYRGEKVGAAIRNAVPSSAPSPFQQDPCPCASRRFSSPGSRSGLGLTGVSANGSGICRDRSQVAESVY
jgi:hypothetical protein